MASILRSSKFVRYIAGFARNVVINTPREFDGSLLNSSQCLCGAITRDFAAQAASHHDQSLEKSLKRIDQDVKKAGRISRRDIEEVLEEIRNTRSATSSQSLLIIRCCGNLVPEELPEVRTQLVQEIWKTLKKIQVPMDISHYNALLRVYLENEYNFSPTDILAELEEKGIEPNRVTYQRLIARYCQSGDIDGATKILEYMREKQLPVNENVFNALIVGHSEAGDMDSAHGIINVMTQASLEPSADTYTILLCGYAKKGDLDTINKLLQECETKEIYLLDKDYLEVVYSLAINGHKEAIPNILSHVKKSMGYNQDAINVMLRLINKGEEDCALEILKTMPRGTAADGSTLPTGGFFIKQIVKANRPFEKIRDICAHLESENMHQRAFLYAAETSLQLGNETLAYELLDELKKRGLEVRQHFFWPLLVQIGGKNNPNEGIVRVLNKMHEMGASISTETMRDYVIPNLKGKSSEIIETLREANVSVGAAASSLVQALLQRNEIGEAALIMSKVQAYYPPDLIRRALTSAFYKTKNLDCYINILREVHESCDKPPFQPDQDEQVLSKSEVVGSFITDLASNKAAFQDVIRDVLAALADKGISISTQAAEKIQDRLGEKMTDEISSLLGRLTSGELTPVPLQKKPMYTPANLMNAAQLEKLVENLKKKDQDVRGLQRQLFNLYYKSKSLEKIEAHFEEWQNDSNFACTSGIYAQMLDVYSFHNNLDKALEFLEKLKAADEAFVLDDSKVVRLAHLLYKSGKFEESVKMLEETPRSEKNDEKSFNYTSMVWRFLNNIAEDGETEKLDTVFNMLLQRGFIEANNVTLGPLIKVHIVNKNYQAALDKLEWCVGRFKTTPWKSELTCNLIQAEDAEKLQRLTDLSTEVHGEINSLYDLVFAFVECGRVRQARKILETPGLQNRPQKINNACERYQQEGLNQPLEGLKDATKDLNHIDRDDIYYQLLLTYIKQKDLDKAEQLWTQMQEENLAPTDAFLSKLGNFLKSEGRPVPFVMPQKPQGKVQHQSVPKLQQPKSQAPSPVLTFRQKLKANQVDEALAIKNTTTEKLSTQDVSLLIEKLLQNNRLAEASHISQELIRNNRLPTNKIFRFLLNKLATAGETTHLETIGQYLDSDTKKNVSFDNRLCHANLAAGKAGEYLAKLEAEITNAKDEEISGISEQFPRGGAYGILEGHPELHEKFESLAMLYNSKGIIAPINVLWTYQFISGNDKKAEQLWNEHLHNAPRIMFARIVQAARDKKDENLVKKLITHLKKSNVTEGALGNAYSCLLDIVTSEENHQKTVETFEEALKDIPIESINRTAVLRVKESFDKLEKPFTYKIPNKLNKPNSSSSSSSDDKVKK